MLNVSGVGIPIARIEGGDFNGKILYLNDPDKKCCEKCTSKCKKKKCCEECEYKKGGCGNCSGGNLESNTDPLEVLNEQYFRNKMRGMTLIQIQHIRKALMKGVEPLDEDLSKIYKEAQKDIKSKRNYEFKLYNEDGKLFPMANQNDEAADHCYVAAPTGAGKSRWVGKYANEIRKQFPKRDVFVFSVHDNDKEIDHLEPKRIMINEEILEAPITKEELRDSIVIFDDIDTIKPHSLAAGVQELRDDLLQNGRKQHIRCVCTSHQLMNYTKTRDLLNSSQKVVFFPESTSSYHIKRFLKEYIGLDVKQIKKIKEIKSRWIMISMIHPRYLLAENTCIILSKLDELCDIREKERYNSKPIKKAK